MRLDHFGHNSEFSVTALPDAEDQLVLFRGLAHDRFGWPQTSQLQADRLPLDSVRRLREGAVPD